MSFVLFLYIVLNCAILLFNNVKSRLLNSYFYVMVPYLVVIVLNNLVFSHFGFNRISDNTIWIHILASMLFFIGNYVYDQFKVKYVSKSAIKKSQEPKKYNYNLIRFIVVVSQVFVLCDLFVRIVMYGFDNISSGLEQYSSLFISSHLCILLVPLSIMLIEDYFSSKNKIDIVLNIVTIFILFSSFTKYHVISYFIIVFIYICSKKPNLIFKIGLCLCGIVFISFCLNYILSFIFTGTSIKLDFFINHFWTYISGGTINIQNGISYYHGKETSLALWLLSMALSFPSIFLNKIFKSSIISYNFDRSHPVWPIGNTSSNVISFVGSVYIQSNIISYMMFIFVWGILCEFASDCSTNSISMISKITSTIFIGYSFLSFFSNFFVLSNPWEMMLLSAVAIFLVQENSFISKFYNKYIWRGQ